MATNNYFNWQYQSNEIDLHNEIVQEVIFNHGFDVKYMFRNKEGIDRLFGENPSSRFESNITVEVYLEEIANYNGDSDFFSKFGLQMDDQATILIHKDRFFAEANQMSDQEIADYGTKPREGDLIHVPFSDSVWEIKQVKNDSEYFQQGKNYVYRIVMSPFEYSHEEFNTGDESIDDINEYSNLIDDLIGTPVYDKHDMSIPEIVEEKDDIIIENNFDDGLGLTVVKRT